MVRATVLTVSKDTTYVTRPSLPPLTEYVRFLKRIWQSRVLSNNGPLVSKFEGELEKYTHGRNVNVVANGTLALQIAIRILFKPGSRIATTPFTFPATTNALIWQGMIPCFLDIDPDTFNLDPVLVQQYLGRGIDGVLSVHVFGNPAGSEKIAAIGRKNHLPVLFDAAHAFGVRTHSGNLFERGQASILSFHATKNFHTFEGGAVVSRSDRISRNVCLLRNFGIVSEEEVEVPGINGKMNEAQAAMGLLNLRYVNRWIGERKQRYETYQALLSPAEAIHFQRLEVARHSYPYMPVVFESRKVRDRVFDALLQHRIRARKYFFPLTSHHHFARKFALDPLPVATKISQRVLTLPLYPDLPLKEVYRISSYILSALRDS